MRARVEAEARFIIETGVTIRRAACVFGTSKTTLHKDVTERLEKISPMLYEDVRKVLNTNKSQRHIRGGKATREKWRKVKED